MATPQYSIEAIDNVDCTAGVDEQGKFLGVVPDVRRPPLERRGAIDGKELDALEMFLTRRYGQKLGNGSETKQFGHDRRPFINLVLLWDRIDKAGPCAPFWSLSNLTRSWGVHLRLRQDRFDAIKTGITINLSLLGAEDLYQDIAPINSLCKPCSGCKPGTKWAYMCRTLALTLR